MICAVRRTERETIDMTVTRDVGEIDVRVAVDLHPDGDDAEVVHVEDAHGSPWGDKLTDDERSDAIDAAWERWTDHGGEA